VDNRAIRSDPRQQWFPTVAKWLILLGIVLFVIANS
jgi:hypothetical protein